MPLEAVSLDEGAPGIMPAEDQVAERLFERAWASALLDAVLKRLELHYQERGKGALFDQLHPFLLDRQTEISVRGVAERLGSSDVAVRQDICRMRRRYREIFRAELGRTVATPAEIDEEMRHLFAVVCR